MTKNTVCYYFHQQNKTLAVPGSPSKKKGGHYYRCYKTTKQALQFCSFNFRTGSAGFIFNNEPPTIPSKVIKLRKSFPVSGKIDILDFNSRRCVGIITRRGEFFDVSENLRGRFIDPTSWKDHFGEPMPDLATQIVLGTGGTDTPGDGAAQFVLKYDSKPAGILIQERLPFFPDPPKRKEQSGLGKVMKRVLPTNIGKILFDVTPPAGWKLAFTEEIDSKDLELLLYCALMTIEIRSW